MALSWTMDKLGPICRAVEDCAIVMQAVYGPDGEDLSTRDAAFNWNAHLDWKSLRVGYFQKEFGPPKEELPKEEKQGASLTDEEKKKQEHRKQMEQAARARPGSRRTSGRNSPCRCLDHTLCKTP